MKILVTGGAGYIGSHAIVALLEAGHEVVVLDNLANGSPEAVTRAAALGGGNVPFIEGDVRDRVLLDELFAEHACDAVMHFAGLKAVGESVEQPLGTSRTTWAGPSPSARRWRRRECTGWSSAPRPRCTARAIHCRGMKRCRRERRAIPMGVPN